MHKFYGAMAKLQIYKVTDCNDDVLNNINLLYHFSFPVEERRPWVNIIKQINLSSQFSMYAVKDSNNSFVGFITTWNFPEAIYIEHFAVSESMRGTGYGTEIIKFFYSLNTNIIFEVELPGSNEMADKRISFYQRNGFKTLPNVAYTQPPYTPDLEPVPMLLMVKNDFQDIDSFVKQFHDLVYNKSLLI